MSITGKVLLPSASRIRAMRLLPMCALMNTANGLPTRTLIDDISNASNKKNTVQTSIARIV